MKPPPPLNTTCYNAYEIPRLKRLTGDDMQYFVYTAQQNTAGNEI